MPLFILIYLYFMIPQHCVTRILYPLGGPSLTAHVTHSNQNAAMLEWAIQGDVTGQIKAFHVRQVSPSVPGEITTTAKFHTFTGLKASSPYTFEVAAENVDGGIGDYAQATITTSKKIPFL